MNVLIACEFSGVVRDAFRARGHNAWSCDLLDAEPAQSGLGHIYHFKGDARRLLNGNIPREMVGDSNWRDTPIFINWDLLIAHPPCTYLANSGARWLYKSDGAIDEARWDNMQAAVTFYTTMWKAQIKRVCVENPIWHSHATKLFMKVAPDAPKPQFVQPWWFGHGEIKATGLRLKNLPPLTPTEIVAGREPRVHHASPGPNRWKERSRTLPGLANAMAEQWGGSYD
jgi:hypothetical protein